MSSRPDALPRAAHRPSTREAMLDAAAAHRGADGTLSLDSAARAAGVTKPGLMYHFSTKEQLLTAVLERLTARYEREMAQAVTALVEAAGDTPADRHFTDATAPQRFLAYVDWACRASLSPADLVIFADPKLRVALTERWREQVDRWLAIPEDATADQRRRLLAVRLMGDGLWFDRASGLLETSAEDAETLRALALELLGADS